MKQQFTFKENGGDVFPKIKDYLLSIGYGFYWADYNNKYCTINL